MLTTNLTEKQIQQMALATYKAEKPDKTAALEKALDIINVLEPEASVDPETLGIAGAICKRLYLEKRTFEENLELIEGMYREIIL